MKRSAYTRSIELEEAIDRLGCGWVQIKVILLTGGIWLADGSLLLLLGSVALTVTQESHLSAVQRGLLMSIVFMGIFVGNIVGGALADTIGRRLPMLAAFVGIFVLTVLTTVATGFAMMLWVRFVLGIFLAVGQPAASAMIAEMVATNRRMHMFSLGLSLFTFGELYAVGLLCSDDVQLAHQNWRWLLRMGALPCAAFFCLASQLLQESPAFLLASGRKDEAEAVLQAMYVENSQPGSVRLLAPPLVSPTRTGTPAMKRNLNMEVLSRFQLLVSPKLRYVTFTASFSYFVLNFITYGGLYAFPQILPEAGAEIAPAVALGWAAAAEISGRVFGFLVGSCFTRQLGIQAYLGFTCVVSFLLVLPLLHPNGTNRLSYSMGILLRGAVDLSKLFGSMGGALLFCFTSELYNTSVRATGTAYCMAVGRLGAIAAPVIFECLMYATGSPVSFMCMMGSLCLVNMGLVHFLNVDTLRPGKD